MPGAFILTILSVFLIVTVLLLVRGHLGLRRSAQRQQPSGAPGDRNRSEDPSEQEEEERARVERAARLHDEARADEAAREVRRGEDAMARWDNEGGSPQP